jgi:NADH dehydrogenase
MSYFVPSCACHCLCDREPIDYDTLIIATGVSHHYFGNDQWQFDAPGLKTIEDAIEIRRRIFMAFEAAEKESDPQKREAWLTFAIA